MSLDFEKVDLGAFGINEDTTAEQVQANMSEAVKIDPVKHANNLKTSKQSGVPTFAVADDPTPVEQRLKLDNIDLSGMSQRSPNTSTYLTNFDNAVIAQDDIRGMEVIERVLSVSGLGAIADQRVTDVLRSVPGGGFTGVGMATEGVARTIDAVSRSGARLADTLLPEALDPYIWRQEDTPDAVESVNEILEILSPVEVVRRAGRGSKQIGQTIAPPMGRQNIATDIGGAVGQVGAQLLATLVAPQTALGMLFAQGVDQQAERQEQTGTEGTTLQSDLGLLSGGVVTAATERVGLDALMNRIPPKIKNDLVRSITDVALAGGIEAVQEIAENVAQGLIEYISTNPDVEIFSDIEREAIAAGGAGAIVRMVINNLAPGKSRSAISEQQYNETLGSAEIEALDEINAAAEQSSMKANDNDAFAEMVEAADGDNDSNVYIDGEGAQTYLQGLKDEGVELDPVLADISVKADEASALGGELIISVGEFARGVAGTEHYIPLRPHMTLSPESIPESRQTTSKEDTAAYVDRMVSLASKHASEYVEAQDIFEEIRDQLVDTGRMSPAEAKMAAKLVPAWATVYANRHDMTVREAYQAAGLVVEGPLTGEKARLDFGNATISEEVEVDGTGETVIIDQPAKKVYEQTKKRRDVVEKLVGCLGA